MGVVGLTTSVCEFKGRDTGGKNITERGRGSKEMGSEKRICKNNVI